MATLTHPLSEDFSWTSVSRSLGCLTPEQAASYDEFGYFVMEDVFDAATMSEVLAEIDPIEREFEDLLRKDGGTAFIARADEITFSTHLVARSERLRHFVSSSPLTDVCADLIGPDVRLYWDQAVYKKPGAAVSFPWHQDNGYAFVLPQQYLTCWIALTDATEENGCPQVLPGVHHQGTLRHRLSETGLICFDESSPEVQAAVTAPVRAGGMVVFSSLTPHCTGPNLTQDVRKAYIVQYAPEGAYVLAGQTRAELVEVPATAPERQFPVLVGGRAVVD
ncbi:MAG TPA: phytanoyl-CoA dioxygenase family protein [Acidimicrobiales bacterium]|jgi:ectoine hydroxylase-related dioxygenase (phytanoyl-CoA dioxygenase family)|nr:phytanoyl-CoA dioxygenase family protein [Acidimicrobiales bacterium]